MSKVIGQTHQIVNHGDTPLGISYEHL
jgi:hypothetical protein